MNEKTVRLVTLGTIGAAVIGGLAYWAVRSELDAEPGCRGDVKRQAGGKLLYFDGRDYADRRACSLAR